MPRVRAAPVAVSAAGAAGDARKPRRLSFRKRPKVGATATRSAGGLRSTGRSVVLSAPHAAAVRLAARNAESPHEHEERRHGTAWASGGGTIAIGGIHHVTAIAADPQRNLDFYAGALGLRLVKRTVNFDDPGTYHLYYGDGAGSPGSILTFFPYVGAHQGRHGVGQAAETRFAVPRGSIGYWVERLMRHHVAAEGPAPRFGDRAPVLSFRDPDGLMLELVGPRRPRERRRLGRARRCRPSTPSAASSASRSGSKPTSGPPRCSPGRWASAPRRRKASATATPAPAGPRSSCAAPPASGPARWALAPSTTSPSACPTSPRRRRRAACWRAKRGSTSRRCSTGSTSAASTSASPAACCSRSPPTRPASPPTSRAERLGESLKLPAWLEGRREAIERRLPELHPPAARPLMAAGVEALAHVFRPGEAPARAGAARPARHRRRRAGHAAAGLRRGAGRAGALAARGGARGRGEPLVPPLRRGRVRPRRPAPPRRRPRRLGRRGARDLPRRPRRPEAGRARLLQRREHRGGCAAGGARAAWPTRPSSCARNTRSTPRQGSTCADCRCSCSRARRTRSCPQRKPRASPRRCGPAAPP